MKTILTLEDELEINDFYKELFDESHYTVINATTYAEVMEEIKKQHIDLFIVDHLLQLSQSEKDGLATATDVKKISPDTKIIMISAHYPAKLEKVYKKYGIDMIIRKPFNVTDLVGYIRRLLTHTE